MISLMSSASQTEKKLNLAYANLRIRGSLWHIRARIAVLQLRLRIERWLRLKRCIDASTPWSYEARKWRVRAAKLFGKHTVHYDGRIRTESYTLLGVTCVTSLDYVTE